MREWLRERTGKTSVPQIFFNERHLGGNAEFQKVVDDREEFDRVLRYAQSMLFEIQMSQNQERDESMLKPMRNVGGGKV